MTRAPASRAVTATARARPLPRPMTSTVWSFSDPVMAVSWRGSWSSSFRGSWSSLVLDGESQLAEDRDGPGLPALEITRAEALARGELISGTQDGLVRVTAFVPDQLITAAPAETMRRKELLRPQPVVFLYRAQYVITGHVGPQPGERICHRVLRDRYG